MKVFVSLMSISVLLLAGCIKPKKSSASAYLSKAKSSNSEVLSDGEVGFPEGDIEQGDIEEPDPSTEEEGDAEAGAELLKPCAACHNSSGQAKTVKLDESAISRLDDALNGSASGFHGGFSDSFKDSNRKNLEAALKVAE